MIGTTWDEITPNQKTLLDPEREKGQKVSCTSEGVIFQDSHTSHENAYCTNCKVILILKNDQVLFSASEEMKEHQLIKRCM